MLDWTSVEDRRVISHHWKVVLLGLIGTLPVPLGGRWYFMRKRGVQAAPGSSHRLRSLRNLIGSYLVIPCSLDCTVGSLENIICSIMHNLPRARGVQIGALFCFPFC